MKAAIAILITALASLSAQAECSITTIRSEEMGAILTREGGYNFPNYDTVCEKLRRANAYIAISSDSVVLSNRSIGWVSIKVKDSKSPLTVDKYARTSTFVSENTSQIVADHNRFQALNDALNAWTDLDAALALLQKTRLEWQMPASKKKQ